MSWTAPLTRPIVLVDGTKLMTFKDALEVMTRRFAGTPASALEPVIDLLVTADITGKSPDIDEASEHLETLLRERRLMD